MRPLRATTGRKKVIQTEIVKIVGPGTYCIISQTIVTPERGSRRASDMVTIADSVALDFLSNR